MPPTASGLTSLAYGACSPRSHYGVIGDWAGHAYRYGHLTAFNIQTYITTFAVYVSACDLEKFFIFNTTVEITSYTLSNSRINKS